MRKADNLPPYCAVVKKSRSLNFLDPSGPGWPVTGVLFIPLYWKNDDDDDLCNAGRSLIGRLSLTASRKKEQFGTSFVNNYEQMQKLCLKSTAKMVSSVATKRNLRHLTSL